MLHRVPAGVGSQRVGRVGHQGHLGGLHRRDELDKRLGGVSLDVELGGQHGTQRIHVGIADVPFIGAGVHRDAFRAEAFAVQRHLHHVGHIAAPGIAQGGHFVDIDA